MIKLRGVKKDRFIDHLIESAWRFNHKDQKIYLLLLKELRNNPLWSRQDPFFYQRNGRFYFLVHRLLSVFFSRRSEFVGALLLQELIFLLQSELWGERSQLHCGASLCCSHWQSYQWSVWRSPRTTGEPGRRLWLLMEWWRRRCTCEEWTSFLNRTPLNLEAYSSWRG